ncbi:MAG: hypothetical protein U9N09_02120 [Euryarchaeota archaeon]|nr:hypothetical protein [Euryarchaeota archaeon]
MNDLGYFVNRMHRSLLRAPADGMEVLVGLCRACVITEPVAWLRGGGVERGQVFMCHG